MKVLEMPIQEQNYSDCNAEQALLSILLAYNSTILQIPRYFTADQFSYQIHREIFLKIKQFYNEGKQANPITLRLELEQPIKETGDANYLIKLLSYVSMNSMNVLDYCEIIHSAWQRTQLAKICTDTLALLSTPASPIDCLSEITKKAEIMLTDSLSGNAFTDYDVSLQIMEDLKNEIKPISTGIGLLDSAMGGGLFERKLYGFAARKKVGKTILASTISYNLACKEIKHLFVCAEMSAKEVQHRILARATDSYESAFRTEYGQSSAFQNKIAIAITESKKCTFFEDKPGITFQDLQQILPVYAIRHKIKGFILDYWQLVGGKDGRKSTAEHLDEVAQWLATFCRKYCVWGIVMAQINQDGNTRGSEGLRLASDQVYEIHREDLSAPCAWLEMMETRYTPWANIGSKEQPKLLMNEKGPFFEELL